MTIENMGKMLIIAKTKKENYDMPQMKSNYEEYEETININIKKIMLILYSNRILMLKCFFITMIFFVLMAFILPKKYTVSADLYINKTNNTNMAEINPYFLEETGGSGGMAALMGGGNGNITNELEIMESPLVINNVIKENNIRSGKLFGLITTKKTGQYVKAQGFLKNIKIDNKKGTNVVNISYKNKDKQFAYNVVNSLVNNYILTQKTLSGTKSKSDLAIIEAEYKKAKENLNANMKQINGLSTTSASGTGNLAAISAFSKSAQIAMSNLQNQLIEGEKSRLEAQEEAQKVAALSGKLQWAKMVEEMSDSSKVLVLKEPELPQDYEQSSPNLLIQLLLGIVLGIITALAAVIFREITNKKLTYSMLEDNIIYNLNDDIKEFKEVIYSNYNKKILVVEFDKILNSKMAQMDDFGNIIYTEAELSKDLMNKLQQADAVLLAAKIFKTDAEEYRIIKNVIKENNKNILKEILI